MPAPLEMNRPRRGRSSGALPDPHVESKHQPPSHTCTFASCVFSCSSDGALSRHFRSEHKSEEPPQLSRFASLTFHDCCNKVYASPHDSCNLFGSQSSQRQDSDDSQEDSHAQGGSQATQPSLDLSCCVCDDFGRFESRAKLISHIRRAHPRTGLSPEFVNTYNLARCDLGCLNFYGKSSLSTQTGL